MENFNFDEENVNKMSPLVLAYIGDTVYEIYIRTMIVSTGNDSVNRLHYKSIKYVSAKAQARILSGISEALSDEEQNIVRRGRNAKSGTIPKNADIIEYKHATGFETLIGYLYLKKRYDRLNELLKISVSKVII